MTLPTADPTLMHILLMATVENTAEQVAISVPSLLGQDPDGPIQETLLSETGC